MRFVPACDARIAKPTGSAGGVANFARCWAVGTSDRAGERSPPFYLQRNATAPRSRGRVGWVRRVSREACWSGHALLRRDDALIGGNIPGKDPKDFRVLASMDTSPAAL